MISVLAAARHRREMGVCHVFQILSQQLSQFGIKGWGDLFPCPRTRLALAQTKPNHAVAEAVTTCKSPDFAAFFLRLITPAALFALLTGGCGSRSNDAPVHFTSDTYRVEIVGEGKRWTAEYFFPADGKGGVESIRVVNGPDLRIPADTTVILELRSRDYVYTFAIPQYQLKELAVPKLQFEMSVPNDTDGELTLLTEPLCGDPHSEFIGRIIVESPDKFWSWLSAQPVQSVSPIEPAKPSETIAPNATQRQQPAAR